jgi:hypothetical protein
MLALRERLIGAWEHLSSISKEMMGFSHLVYLSGVLLRVLLDFIRLFGSDSSMQITCIEGYLNNL